MIKSLILFIYCLTMSIVFASDVKIESSYHYKTLLSSLIFEDIETFKLKYKREVENSPEIFFLITDSLIKSQKFDQATECFEEGFKAFSIKNKKYNILVSFDYLDIVFKTSYDKAKKIGKFWEVFMSTQIDLIASESPISPEVEILFIYNYSKLYKNIYEEISEHREILKKITEFVNYFDKGSFTYQCHSLGFRQMIDKRKQKAIIDEESKAKSQEVSEKNNGSSSSAPELDQSAETLEPTIMTTEQLVSDPIPEAKKDTSEIVEKKLSILSGEPQMVHSDPSDHQQLSEKQIALSKSQKLGLPIIVDDRGKNLPKSSANKKRREKQIAKARAQRLELKGDTSLVSTEESQLDVADAKEKTSKPSKDAKQILSQSHMRIEEID